MRQQMWVMLHPDTIAYMQVLRDQWGLKSQSEVIDALVRKRWKGDQVRRQKFMDKPKKVA